MRLSPTLKEYSLSFLFSAALIGFLYALVSRDASETGLSALNVSLASGTLFLLGIVLLLGPLSRMYAVFDWAFTYRKGLGVMSFFTGLAHVYFVMFPLARNGPWGLYTSRPWSAYPGLEALVLLFILLLLSNRYAEHALGRLWWQIQYWGVRVTFALIAVHMFVLKYKTILDWFIPGNAPETGGVVHTPPLIVWESQFVLLVLLIRLSEFFGKSLGRIIATGSFLMVTLIMLWATFLR